VAEPGIRVLPLKLNRSILIISKMVISSVFYFI
jgi:hypothetical protein